MQELIIESGRAERHYWKDLWRYRELFYFLAWRDLLVRYKQTIVGVAWAVVRPVLTMVVLTIVFSKFAKMAAPPGVPYPILVFCGMLPWQFFAAALTESGNSLINNSNLVSKVYFPRLVVPASSIIASFVDFFISAGFLILLMIWYQFVPSLRILAVPLFVALVVAAALGVGLWTAALMVQYRDFRFIVPFVVQFGLYISPVGYDSSQVPEEWRIVYSLNPIVGVIDGFRWAALGSNSAMYWPGFWMSCLTVGFLMVTGLRYFRKTERAFADVI
jgi:lipopolysaccharide transport system permease protein